jgi:SAM-dependent methyltransferase
VLEVGCGGGALLYDLERLGYTGVGVEESPRAVEIAKRVLANAKGMSILPQMPVDASVFDYLMAYEVLEHIEDDRAALKTWSDFLRPGGTLVLSVPARMDLWSASDVWAGHFRRYELNELRDKVSAAGFDIERIVCYGWPLSNVVEPIRAAVHGRKLRQQQNAGRDPASEKHIRTGDSGVVRDTEMRLYPLYSTWGGRMCLQLFGTLQRFSFNRDWGTGYIVLGQKR